MSVEMMAYPTVRFENVGRDKRTWTAKVRKMDHACLAQAVRSQGAIRSSDVMFVWDHLKNEGDIIVGGFRHVGSFRVVETEVPHV